jgi:hypothetical protein
MAASSLPHGAAGAVVGGKEGNAAWASLGCEGVISFSMLLACEWQIAAFQLERVRNENKWRWELLGRVKTVLELAWRDCTRHAWRLCFIAAGKCSSWATADISTNMLSFQPLCFMVGVRHEQEWLSTAQP